MKSFREQMNQMALWFTQWNVSEQTIALYALLARVSAEQSRFLSLLLENNLKAKSGALADMDETERQANDPDYITALVHAASHESLASQLIPRLLLLQPGNVEARQAYLKLLPVATRLGGGVAGETGGTVVNGGGGGDSSANALAAARHQHYDDCRQLLSLTLVHPAFPGDEKLAVRGWLAQLEEQARSWTAGDLSSPPPPGVIGSIPHHQHQHQHHQHHQRWASVGSPVTFKQQEPFNVEPPMGPINQIFPASNGHRFAVGLPVGFSQNRRTRSLMREVHQPPSPQQQQQQGLGLGLDDDGDIGVRQSRSQSFPMSAFMHSESARHQQQQQQQQQQFQQSQLQQSQQHGPWVSGRGKSLVGFEKPGMRDVPVWLKSLRLHKYQELFAQMSFDDMMTLTEEELEEKSVTKGARHKIVGSIQKLKERGNQLDAMEEDVAKPSRLPQIIQDLKMMIVTPIKPPQPEDSGRPSPSGSILHSNSDGQLNLIQQQTQRDAATGGGGNRGSSLDAESVSSSSSREKIAEEHMTVKFVRVLRKAYAQFQSGGVDDDMFSTFVSILDKVLVNEAFEVDLKKIVFSLRDHCQKDPRHFYRRSNEMKGPQRSYSGSGHSLHSSMMSGKSATLPSPNRRRIPRLPVSGAPSLTGTSVTMSPHLMGMGFVPSQHQLPGMGGGGAASAAGGYRTSSMSAVRPSHGRQMESFVRTYSGPPSLPFDKGSYGSNPDFYGGEGDHYMERLCQQVTDHALSDSTERSGSAY